MKLRQTNQFQKIVIFYDNLRVHKTQKVLTKLEQQGIKALFIVPYQPDLNPAECCLSKIKNYYKRQKLRSIVDGIKPDYEKLIRESIGCLKKEDIFNSVKFSMRLLNKA